MTRALHILALLPVLASCAGDIKGETGEPGPPGISINANKPRYEQPADDTTEVIVPASVAQPATIGIAGGTYTNDSNVVCDVSIAGRNGRDTGALQAGKMYYLYAIPAESGTTFDTVASLFPPTSGPTGFSEWSYLGAFRVDDAGFVSPFTKIEGTSFYLARKQFFSSTTTVKTYQPIDLNASAATAGTTPILPETALGVWLEVRVSTAVSNPGPTTISRGYVALSANGTNLWATTAAWSQVAVGTALSSSEELPISLDNNGTIYYVISGPSDVETRLTYVMSLMGFIEHAELWP